MIDPTVDNWRMSVQISNLQAENTRLQIALERFVRLCPSPEGLGGHAPMGAFSIAADYARAALAALDATTTEIGA